MNEAPVRPEIAEDEREITEHNRMSVDRERKTK